MNNIFIIKIKGGNLKGKVAVRAKKKMSVPAMPFACQPQAAAMRFLDFEKGEIVLDASLSE